MIIAVIENLGLKPRRSTTALLLNIRTFTKYMLECETWKSDRYRFYPTPEQESLLRRTLGCVRLVYNKGSSVCVMQWTGVIRDGTLIEKGI